MSSPAQTDKGLELFNMQFAALMKRYKIEHFASNSDLKAAFVVRFNSIIKTRIYTYMTSNRLVDVLQDMENSYNHSRQRSIGMAPADERKNDEDRLWVRLYPDGDTIRERIEPLADNTMVRINLSKTSFDNGFLQN